MPQLRQRLLTSVEWQAAALGTPVAAEADNDTTECQIHGDEAGPAINAGSRSLCVSDVGAYDMVGNLFEGVADWTEAVGCGDWIANDVACFGGDGNASNLPVAQKRGGSFDSQQAAGVCTVGTGPPTFSSHSTGFRCAR